MASILDFSNFTFSAEQVRDINELVFDEVLHAPDLNFIHSMHTGIVYDREIGFIGEGGLVGVAKQGCNPTPQDFAIGTRKVTWTPKAWEILLDECANDLAATAALYAQHKGNRVDDLTDTDYMAIVVQVLEAAIRDFFYRILWLGDTAAENYHESQLPKAALTEQTVDQQLVGTVYVEVKSTVTGAVKCAFANGTIIYLSGTASTGNAVADTNYYSKDTSDKVTVVGGGVVTNGVETKYFTLLDGFFKQLRAAVVAKPALGVTIAANSQASYAAQDSNMTDAAAIAILEAMYYAAPIELRTSGNMRFLVTQSIADAYQKYLVGKGIESTYRNLVDGLNSLTYLGIPVIAMPIWDKQIRAYEDDGTKYSFPHRAVLIEKDNLAVGTPSAEAYESANIWYEKKERKNYIEVMDKLDGKLLNTGRLIYAE